MQELHENPYVSPVGGIEIGMGATAAVTSSQRDAASSAPTLVSFGMRSVRMEWILAFACGCACCYGVGWMVCGYVCAS
jgi:hypothetical protein